ncbi:hypothetical protein Tco_0769401 [Tanacetum coccineum]|uniref:Uncharacterized protein n=1 Tax=Tanacetum coccineum TaxID=301880 RepID=A0ABQ4ZAB8_9ASTR
MIFPSLSSLRKRLYLSTLGSRYEVGESSTARPTRGQGIDYGFVSTVDAEERRQGIRDVGYGSRAYMGRSADRKDARTSRSRIITASRYGLTLQQGIRDVGHKIRDTWVDPAKAVPEIAPMTVGEVNTRVTAQHQVHETRFQMQHAELAALRETDRRR